MNSLVKTTIACLAVLAVVGDLASYASAEPYKKKRLRAPYAGKYYSRSVGGRFMTNSTVAAIGADHQWTAGLLWGMSP